MAALIDTNVLVYRFDSRFPDKQRCAEELLREGIENDTIRIPHQAVLELVAVLRRPLIAGQPVMPWSEALREVEELLNQFTVLFPNPSVVRTALRGAAAYQLSWFDAHLWAYAEHYGLEHLISEDFEHDRLYGSVRVIDPFR